MNELISIVVPVYNVEEYIERCIKSIRCQTYKNIEIIVVDDGSTDSSGMICDKLKEKYNLLVIHKENGGLSDARNCGIKQAKGEYIGFIDSDDYIETNMFEELYDNIVKTQADISICSMYIDYPDGRTQAKGDGKTIEVYNKVESLIALNSYKGFDMSACTKLYKKALFDDLTFPKGKKCEDYYIMYKLFSLANRVVYRNSPLYHYYQREFSISRNVNNSSNDAYIDASKTQVDFFRKYYPDIVYVAESALVFAYIAKVNNCITYNLKFDNNAINYLQTEVRKRIRYVLTNKYLPALKKMQALVFAISVKLYCCLKNII